jgi:hypothetical protein
MVNIELPVQTASGSVTNSIALRTLDSQVRVEPVRERIERAQSDVTREMDYTPSGTRVPFGIGR